MEGTESAKAVPARAGFLGALNAAIAAGFLASVFLPNDALIDLVVGPGGSKFVRVHERMQLLMVLEYVAPSAIAFFFVRRLPISFWQAAVMLVCNAFLIASVAMRYWMLDHDLSWLGAFIGMGLVVLEQLVPLSTTLPVLLVSIADLRKMPGAQEAPPRSRRWLTAVEMAVVALAGLVPLGYWAVRLNSGENTARGEAQAKAARWAELCRGVTIDVRRIASDAKGVLFARSFGAEPGLLTKLEFVEVELAPGNYRLGMPYLEYTPLRNRPPFENGQFTGGEGPVPEARAEYEVSQAQLQNRSEPAMSFFTSEVTARHRQTGEVIAQYTYVMESGNGPRKFCPSGFGSNFRYDMLAYLFGAMDAEEARGMAKKIADFAPTARRGSR